FACLTNNAGASRTFVALFAQVSPKQCRAVVLGGIIAVTSMAARLKRCKHVKRRQTRAGRRFGAGPADRPGILPRAARRSVRRLWRRRAVHVGPGAERTIFGPGNESLHSSLRAGAAGGELVSGEWRVVSGCALVASLSAIEERAEEGVARHRE